MPFLLRFSRGLAAVNTWFGYLSGIVIVFCAGILVFEVVVQLEAARVQHLEAVVLGGVVRGGDHDPGPEAARAVVSRLIVMPLTTEAVAASDA